MTLKPMVLAASGALSMVVFAETPAELEKAFNDAYVAGEPLKADQAFRKMIEKNPKVAPIRYYQGAEVSRELGKGTDRRVRLAYYLKAEKAWNETTEQAAWELCISGADANQFVLLISRVKPTRTLFWSGIRMLEQFRSQRRCSDFKKVASAMLPNFKDESDRGRILGIIGGLLYDNVPGFTAEDARSFFERYPTKDQGSLDWIMRHRREAFPPMWRLNYMAQNQVLMTQEPYQYVWNIDYRNAEECAKAAKDLVAIEKIVLDGKHPSQSYWWLRQRIELRGYLFKPAETNQMSASFLALFDKVVACEPKVGVNDLRDLAQWICERCVVPADRAKIPQKYPQYCHAGTLLGYGGLRGQCERDKNANAVIGFLAKNPDRHDVAWDALRDPLAKFGAKDAVFKEVEHRIVNTWDGRLDCWHLISAVCEIKGLSGKDRADFLDRVYKKTGAHQFWNFMIDEKRPHGWPSLTNQFCQAFIKGLKKDAKSAERIVEIRREIHNVGRGQNNICPEQGHKLFAEACKVFPGTWPDGKRWDNGLMEQITGRYLDLCQHNMESAPICCQAVMDKLTPKDKGAWSGVFSWNNVLRNSRDGKDYFYNKAVVRRALNTGDPNYLDGLGFPKGTAKLPDGIDANKMGGWQLGNLIKNNWMWRDGNRRSFKPELAASLFITWFKNNDVNRFGNDNNWTIDLFRTLHTVADAAPAEFAQFPFDKVAGELIGRPGANEDYLRMFLAFCTRVGRGPQYVQKYYDFLAKAEPAVRLNQLVRIGEMGDVITYGDSKRKIADLFTAYMRDQLVPALKAAPLRYAAMCQLGGYGQLATRVNEVRGWCYEESRKAPQDAAKKKSYQDFCKLADAFYDENVRLKTNGASGWWEDSQRGAARYWCDVYNRALAVTNRVAMSRYARDTGATMNPWTTGWETMNRFLDQTRKTEQWEALYLLANSLQNFDANQYSTAVRLRAEASTHLPGVYPVTEKDPLYPLYVAADEFNRNNFERATALFKKALPVFEREAAKLPPDFTAWAIDQLRMERGKKDVMLLKAKTLATQLLADESKITTELAAAMILVKAECYRDQQNFEAAKLEYQTIRNSPVYSKTKAGRKAMYRSIDLMIETGNSAGAESTLEYWLSQPDKDLQAQAHYFLARIAFERSDYEEVRKQLREVFSIDFTHTEGRFLEGKWKLATGNEVDDTEVMIGKLADRTMIRPGQQLTISVQDRNLSVAGGGASIPVVVTTKPGNDRERIYLYPSPRDPTLFKGVIDVKLGKVVCSNLVLEVTGQDTASYCIDPEYLKVRGLTGNESKKLRVVDDGRLAIGAGAPRTEEKENRDRIAKMVESGVDDGHGYRPSLRPGNPLYIAVMDKDRSLGMEDGQIAVAVTTASGDRLDNVMLKEAAPFTGIFRGQVPTALPPPRAYASDSAVGFNPGDVINSTRDAEWKSLPDGQPGKWFAVDTMGSHEVSNIVLKMKAPEEVRSIRLTGTLGANRMVLGTIPAGSIEGKKGLRLQTEWNIGARDAAGVVTFFERPQAPRASVVTNLSHRMKYNNGNAQTAYFNGAFAMPSGYGYLRLRLEPLVTAGETFKTLWLTATIDGKPFFNGSGAGLVNQIVTLDVEPGVHRLTVCSTAKVDSDGWRIVWEPVGEAPQAFPADWFDVKAHPEIIDYIADKAVITRVKDGFVATFRKPCRLRTMRVDFLDRTGPDVQLDEFAANDWAGKAILPVESDFSDAQHNDTLEVAPGDTISVRYSDENTTVGESRILTKTINSSFNDAKIGFYFEDVQVTERGTDTKLYTAYRFVPGDTLLVQLTDPDLDLSEEADTVEVTVKSEKGGEMKLRLVEQERKDAGGDVEGVHTGYFLGLLKTCPLSVTNASKKVMRCANDESLTVSYIDRENTNPGVPFIRTSRVNATRKATPSVTLFHTRVKRVEDTSALAKAKLAAIRRRAGNEKVEKVYCNVVGAIPMSRIVCASTGDIPVNVAAPMPIRVNDPSRARHEASVIKVEAWAESEETRAKEDGDDIEKKVLTLHLAAGFEGVNLLKGGESQYEARTAGSFNGTIKFAVGGVDPNADPLTAYGNSGGDRGSITLAVNGSDRVFVRVLDENGDAIITRTLTLVSNASMGLMDSTWSAERNTTHVGERFYLTVEDPDRDLSNEADNLEVDVTTTGGTSRKMILSETLPHSGVFTGMIRPTIFPPSEKIPEVVTGAEATVEQLLAEDRLSVKYGENVLFKYKDEEVLPGTPVRTLCVTGMVHKGADGNVRLFSKRFRDTDMAVLVQFRLAECLFEQAKDHRKLKHPEKSAEAIAKGRAILEEALKNNPESAHVAQGEFLLANLYQELGAEEKQNGDKSKAKQLFAEALARFSSILAVWPEGEYAPRSQYHKAYCLEMLKEYKLAGEEYVKMTYLYPDSPLVGDATIRLATYYYKEEKKYEVAARIYKNFAKRFPQHDKAPRSLFMCGSCYIKEGERIRAEAIKAAKADAEKRHVEVNPERIMPAKTVEMYKHAVLAFVDMGEKFRSTTTPELRAQALYWAGDASVRTEDAKNAYIYLKRCVLEYPETEWARRARGLLLQNGKLFKDID